MTNETNQTQQRRAAEEVDKPLQLQGGNEKMENKSNANTLYRLAEKALLRGDFVSADAHARSLAELEGKSVYTSLARAVACPSEEDEMMFKDEWELYSVIERCFEGLRRGYGEPARKNEEFAQALSEEARVLGNRLWVSRFRR